MEILDIVDKAGIPTGETAERAKAHESGLRHRTSHVWLLRRHGGQIEILLQKRSAQKDSFPGCYDISSAGHIPAGVDYISSALRELEEELGVCAQPSALIDCGLRAFTFEKEFHGKPFHDNQVSRVFALWLDREETEFILQKSEVESVRWMELSACKKAVRDGSLPTCIFPEELEMVEKAIH